MLHHARVSVQFGMGMGMKGGRGSHATRFGRSGMVGVRMKRTADGCDGNVDRKQNKC